MVADEAGGRRVGVERGASGMVVTRQPSGRKSQAVLSDTSGIPGVSGLLNAYGVPTRPLLAKLPGVVPCRVVDGLSPIGGRMYGVGMKFEVWVRSVIVFRCKSYPTESSFPAPVASVHCSTLLCGCVVTPR